MRVLFTIILAVACINMPVSSLANNSHAKDDPGVISHKTIPYKNLNLHYAYAGNNKNPGVIFLHGTPGNWKAFSSAEFIQ